MKTLPPVPDPWAETRKIRLIVKEPEGRKLEFKIKKSTPLRKLMEVYCRPVGLGQQQVHFMTNGKRILPDDTAAKLGIEHNDTILFYIAC